MNGRNEIMTGGRRSAGLFANDVPPLQN